MNGEKQPAVGVQELIDKLRQEGVAKGQSEADVLITEARRKAMALLDDAQQQAEAILAEARAEAERIRESGMTALRLASRDVILHVKESFQESFVERVRQLVAHTLQDRGFLERLILEIAGRAVPKSTDQKMELLLPEVPPTVEQMRAEPASMREEPLSQFALGLAADVLRDGVTFAASDEVGAGLRVRLQDDDVQIELTDETVTELLMQHLRPRFRAILESR